MGAPTLSPELALRIGMAARELPEMDPKRLMSALVGALGMPLSEQKLAQLTVERLLSVGGAELSHVPLPRIKSALDYLWGRRAVEIADDRPPIEAISEDGMPGSIRVAVASNGGERLDGHFGNCARFLIYQVSPAEIRLVDLRRAAGGETADERNTLRAKGIADCHLLYVVSIGGPAAAKVVKQDIHPIKVPEGGEARAVLREIQTVLAGNPPPWLAKVIGKRPIAPRSEE